MKRHATRVVDRRQHVGRLIAVFCWCLPDEWVWASDIAPKFACRGLLTDIEWHRHEPPPGVEVRVGRAGIQFRARDPEQVRAYIGQLHFPGGD